MKRIAVWFAQVVLLAPLLVQISRAQGPATGTPNFGSFGGGPFDVINLGNLNTHFTVPVIHKAGRAGFNFTYDLSYDSSIWYTVSSNGTQSWQPVTNWGWRGQTEVLVGYVTYTSVYSGPACYNAGSPTGVQYTQSNWTYHDGFGAAHPFTGSTIRYQGSAAYCPPDTSLTVTAGDGSGWRLWATGGSLNSITSSGGKVLHPPVNTTGGTGTGTDANGNIISVNGSAQFFDTLSSTTAVLTVGGAGTQASPMTFSYIPPANESSGTRVSVQVNYITYTVQTNFGATDSGGNAIAEYGPFAINLVDNITFPDGSRYTFSYEPTPSIPSSGACTPLTGTPSCVTGRIQSVTLPTGGNISYAYRDGANGIESDGSTAGIVRTVTPSGQWTYDRSAGQGTNGWITTIVDPNSNQTVIKFQKGPANNFYETYRTAYQGSSAMIGQSYNCWNGQSGSACLNTPVVSAAITALNSYTIRADGTTNAVAFTYSSIGLLTQRNDYDWGQTLVRETDITYASLGNNIVDHPASVVVKDASGTPKNDYVLDLGKL